MATETKTYPIEMELPSGKKAVLRRFTGKDVRIAMTIANNVKGGLDQNQMIFALIASTATIDGQQIVMEDIDDMDGPDVLALMGEFGDAFTQPQKQ